MSPKYVNFGPLAAEIGPVVWGTPANFNGFRVLTALLHGTDKLCGVEQRSPPIIRQGGHHVGHWPTILVAFVVLGLVSSVLRRAIGWEERL